MYFAAWNIEILAGVGGWGGGGGGDGGGVSVVGSGGRVGLGESG